MVDVLVLTLNGPEETTAAGKTLGRMLVGQTFIALNGPLGAGKTQFVKGLARGLDVPADDPVVSPTFVLAREYAGRLKLYHLDAYRLGSTDELLDLGLDEMYGTPGNVVALEWADRTPDLPRPADWTLEFAHLDERTRRATVATTTGRLDEFETALRSAGIHLSRAPADNSARSS